MDSFIIRLENFFKMTNDDGSRLDVNKSSYFIPKYQREYTWDNDMILDLINDIEDRDKFLGIIMLDAVGNHYEIIDGQQRTTTCYMILAALYNAYAESPREQERIKSIIQPFGENVLVNDSIGEYLVIQDNRIKISVSNNDLIDIYSQRESFQRAYSCIETVINDFSMQGKLRNFYRKLKDCKFLVLINDDHGSTKPVEQMFLDINEKSKLLDPADIFKGHCFENFDDEYADDLKDLWVALKRCSISFKKFKVKDLSEYIYNYLLITDNNKITEKLKMNGKHYLYGYDMDATEKLLRKMIAYGESIVNLYDNIDRNEYFFEDLCVDALSYRATGEHKVLKHMFRDILGFDAQYSKLPIMYFVFVLSDNNNLAKEIEYDTFKRIVTNLYVYAVLFLLSPNKKSKSGIDYSVRDALNGEDNVLINTRNSAKQLRDSKMEKFNMPPKCNDYHILSCIYSIMDNYVAADNWLSKKYNRDDRVNLEHFVMPDNRECIVDWIRDNEERTVFSIPVRKALATEYKKNTINYLLLDEDLNRSLHNYDIVEKIKLIRNWCQVDENNSCLPKHVKIIIEHIENMGSYQELVEMKRRDETDENIFGYKYFTFLEEYFSEHNQNSLLIILKNEFERSFQN